MPNMTYTSVLWTLLRFAHWFRIYHHLKWLQRTQWKSPAELRELQEKRLRAIIFHAYYNIPFYHKKFKDAGITPNDIKTIEDLKKIPVTTKDEIKAHWREIINPKVDLNKARIVPTSGSTGVPLKVVYDQKADAFSRAVNLRSHIENGLRFYHKWVIIGDTRTAPPSTWFQKLGIFRIYYINLFDPVEAQIAALEQINPDIITGYPSQLKLIARKMIELGADLEPVTVFTTAEVLDDKTRKIIERGFNTDVDLFGCIELNRTAWECKGHFGYHMDAEAVIFEFLDENGEEVSPGEEGEIYYTGLYNYAMPFIRYKVGDIGVPSDEKSPCGRGLPLMERVVGRKDDYIKLPDGTLISPIQFHLVVKHISGIWEAKIIQEKIDRIKVLLVPDTNFSDNTFRRLKQEIMKICKHQCEVEIKCVDSIPREKSGKIRMIESRITNEK